MPTNGKSDAVNVTVNLSCGAVGECLAAEVREALTDIARRLAAIELQGEQVMAQLSEFREILSQIDSETTRIANRIAELLEAIRTGGMNEADEATALAELQANLANLRAIGTSTTEPVPEPVPESFNVAASKKKR